MAGVLCSRVTRTDTSCLAPLSTPKDKSMNPFCNYAPNSVPKLCNYHGLVTTPLKSYIEPFSLYFPTLNYNYLYDPSIHPVTFPFQQKHKVQELPATYDWMAISNEMHINSLNNTKLRSWKNYPVFAKYRDLCFYSPSAHRSLNDMNSSWTQRVSEMSGIILKRPARWILEYKKENAKETYVNTGIHHALQREMIEYVRIIK